MDCGEFLVVPGFALVCRVVSSGICGWKCDFFDVTTWIKRGGLRGSCGHFDGGFGTWLLNGR